MRSRDRSWLILAGVVMYVAAVHAVDGMAHHPRAFPFWYRHFRWQAANGFDLFEFAFWLVVPFTFAAWRMDWLWLTFKRWKRADWVILGAGLILGAAAIAAIPLFKSLSTYYGGFEGSASVKLGIAMHNLVWTCSWLFGWEFIHRYVLLRAAATPCPRYGWILVPLAEGLYHLQKPWPEAMGMLLFSVVATQWALRRQNLLLPLIVHLFIELALIVAMCW